MHLCISTYQLRITQQDLKIEKNKKSFQNFIWKNKTSPLLKTQEKDFQLKELRLVVSILALLLCGTSSTSTGTSPLSCLLLDNRLYLSSGFGSQLKTKDL